MENIPVRTECQGVDGVGVVQSVQMLAVIEIPEHGLGVLAARGTEGAVRGHSDGVQVACVADVVGLQLAVGQVPHLDILVPSSGHDDGVLVVGREPHAGDPVLVAILLDGVLALGKSVPQLDGLVSGGGHDLPVVSREGDGEHVLGVVLEPAGSLASGQVPESQGLVPGSRQGEVAIRREDHVRDKVAMPVKAFLWDAIVSNIVPKEIKHYKMIGIRYKYFLLIKVTI